MFRAAPGNGSLRWPGARASVRVERILSTEHRRACGRTGEAGDQCIQVADVDERRGGVGRRLEVPAGHGGVDGGVAVVVQRVTKLVEDAVAVVGAVGRE